MADWTDVAVPIAGAPGVRLAPRGALTEPAIMDELARYRKLVAKRYRAIEAARLAAIMREGQLTISPKLDGELWFLVKHAGYVALVAPNGRVAVGLPALADADARLASVDAIVVAGELVGQSPDGRPRVGHVAAALGDAARLGELSFHAFDVVAEGGADAGLRPYGERLARLEQLLGEAKPGALAARLGVVPTETIPAAELEARYRAWTEGGRAEGLVARSEQGVVFKVKPQLTLDVVVVAFGERLGEAGPELRELAVAVLRDDGAFQLVGSVGGGFSADDRRRWLATLAPTVKPSAFRMANGDGTLSRFVEPRHVVEVRCSDLLTLDGTDQPTRRMTLSYAPDTGWTPFGERVGATMLHPVFVRARDDKAVRASDVGFDQLTRHVPIDEPLVGEAAAPLHAARVVARGVWTKETKGKLAVRKYALLAHPPHPRREVPPFSVFFTDFSAGRAEPLDTSVRWAATRAAADAAIEAWKAENVKRGWVLADERAG